MEEKDDFLAEGNVLSPVKKLELLINQAKEVEVDPKIPPIRYYKSGLQMVRMAKVYLEEGSYEKSFLLYMKFMIIFIEKIRNHPDFGTVPKEEKSKNSQKLKEVLPTTEDLKKKLMEQYEQEYDRYLKDTERRRERMMVEKLKNGDEEKRKTPFYGQLKDVSTVTFGTMKMQHSIVPSIDNLTFPDTESLVVRQDKPEPKPISFRPPINRSSKPSYVNQSSQPNKLRVVVVPGDLVEKFLSIAFSNTSRKIETGGILAGKLKKDLLIVTHLLVPEQVGTQDSCTTQREEDIFDYQEQHELITLGWIHTHPTQTAFMSSVDLHTHYAYQRMIPEALAIVCAPQHNNLFFSLTEFGLDYISQCQETGFHPHQTQTPIYMEAKHYKAESQASLVIVDLRRSRK